MHTKAMFYCNEQLGIPNNLAHQSKHSHFQKKKGNKKRKAHI